MIYLVNGAPAEIVSEAACERLGPVILGPKTKARIEALRAGDPALLFEVPPGNELVEVERAAIYWRLRSGHYGLKGTGHAPSGPRKVRVVLRDGEVRTETLGRVIFADPGKAWIATMTRWSRAVR